MFGNENYEEKLNVFKSLIKSKRLIKQLELIESCNFLHLSSQSNRIASSLIDLSWTCHPSQMVIDTLYTISFNFYKGEFEFYSSYLDGVDNFKLSKQGLFYLKGLAQQNFDKYLNAQKSKPKVKAKPKPTDLYLIHDTVLNSLKIGKSKNPKSRLQQLQISTSNKLVLLETVKNGGHLEETLHSMFEEFKLNGEWFKFTNEIIEYFKYLNE